MRDLFLTPTKLRFRPYQQTSVNLTSLYMNTPDPKGKMKTGLVVAPVGCHAKGHPIMMLDGTFKNVEDIVEEDKLMGIDSTERKVLKTISGTDKMYKITLSRGIAFNVNGEHILRLYRSVEGEDRRYSNELMPKVLDIPVNEFLTLPEWRKKEYRIKVNDDPIVFTEQKKPILEPYFLGLWLGDGTGCRQDVTTMDPEIVDYLYGYASRLGMNVSKHDKKGNNRASTYKLTGYYDKKFKRGQFHYNEVLEGLRSYNMIDNKHIPHELKTGSLETRRRILEGLIDSDGTYSKNNRYSITQKSKELSYDIYFLVKSLGLTSSIKKVAKRCMNCKDTSPRIYYRVTFREDVDIKPKLPRKQFQGFKYQSTGKKSSFKINEVDKGDYYGFVLDGDNLYMDRDFIIHHNSGKSFMIAGTVMNISTPVLIIQPSKELLEQNYEKYVNAGGAASMYSASLGVKQISSDATYATLGSIRKDAQKFIKAGVKHVIVDEAHMNIPPDVNSMFMKFISELNPTHVLGYTATPIKLKGSNSFLRLNFLTRMRPKFFKDVVAVTQISEILDFWPQLKYTEFAFDSSALVLNAKGTEYTEKSVRVAVSKNKINNQIATIIAKNKKHIGSTLVFVDSVANAYVFSEWIAKTTGLKTAVVEGKTSRKERERIVIQFKNKEIDVVLNVSTMTTGFDFPGLETVIMGRPTNSFALYYQVVGRLMRMHPQNRIKHFVDFCGNVGTFGKIHDIEILNLYKSGWALCSGDRVISNVPLERKISKHEHITHSIATKHKVLTPHFGEYLHKPFHIVPDSYLRHMIKEIEETRGKGLPIHGLYLQFEALAGELLYMRNKLNYNVH